MRLRRDMPQWKLGEIVGIGQYHVSRMEWGDQVMSVELLFRFAMALGVMPQELVDPTIDGRFWLYKVDKKGGDTTAFHDTISDV